MQKTALVPYARWLLYGPSIDKDLSDLRDTSCVWETKILFFTRNSDETPALLTWRDPEVPDTADPTRPAPSSCAG
ncbi:hypothetical protein [Streptomyces erythrochromogenes]|uniref:hypothetical protein n=1 Tax=Streptomyces erythrochromogenes TaxID=285574 RepID=UPI00369ECBCC